jgi:hypothetical protein
MFEFGKCERCLNQSTKKESHGQKIQANAYRSGKKTCIESGTKS